MRLGHAALVLYLAAHATTASAERRLWTRVASPEPKDAVSFREAAYRALEEQQSALASRAALEAVRRAPRSAESHVLLGHARTLAGDYARATESYEEALRLDEDALRDVRDASWASRAAIHAEHWALAVHTLRVMTERLPKIPARTLAYSRLGDALQALGRDHLEAAMTAYRHALLDARGFLPSACVGLALALTRMGREDEALGWLDRALDQASVDDLVEATTGPSSEREARRALLESRRRALERGAR